MRSSKRVLFIERNLRNEKLGVMYLSASLKSKGHHADLVQADKENLDDYIADYKPDFVAFSITTGEHIFALQTAKEIKAKYNIPNIFGGPHCTFYPEIGFEADVDFVVQGYGEVAIVDIVEGRIKKGFHKAAMIEDLHNLPHPDRTLFYKYAEFAQNPLRHAITSRACPYRCSYCFNHSMLALTKIDGTTKQWFNRREVKDVTKEINDLQEEYPTDKILFVDDSFIQGHAWLHDFLDAYTRDVKLNWICSLRVNCLDEILAEKMFNSRLEVVNYALESADPDVQQRLLNRGQISNADVIRAIGLFNKYGVKARMQNMIGLPLSNPLEDALNTLQFNRINRVTDSWCSLFQPYPRTALGQYCVDNGYTTSDQLRYCTESFFDESRMNIPNTSELYALQKLWYFFIDANISLDLIQILIKGKISADLGDQLQRLRFKCSRKKLFGFENVEPELAVDFKSRERWNFLSHSINPSVPSSLDPLMKQAFAGIDVPTRLVELLARADFDEKTRNDLYRYNSGETVNPPPLYTLDENGALKDPAISTFIRGTENPDARDIRKMPEAHFMAGMAEVRAQLASGDRTPRSPGAVSNTGATLTATVVAEDGSRDERHRNQFLS